MLYPLFPSLNTSLLYANEVGLLPMNSLLHRESRCDDVVVEGLPKTWEHAPVMRPLIGTNSVRTKLNIIQSPRNCKLGITIGSSEKVAKW